MSSESPALGGQRHASAACSIGHPDSQGHLFTHGNLLLESAQQIRLIRLYPGSVEDALSCEVFTVDLSNHLTYDAVSYTWATEDGDDSRSHLINCNGKSLSITENCDAVLRMLRLRSMPRPLWVDSICIDQNNVQERNHQVGLMDRIYRMASMVHICISDSKHDYSEAFRWLKYMRGDKKHTAFVQMKQLFCRRYFTRVWVTQEVVLAEAVVLHVNEDSILLAPEILRRLMPSCWTYQIDVPVQLQWVSASRHLDSLVRCLRLSINANSSDARDKVFGIMSLVRPELRSLVPVDYTLSWSQVFESATAACIYECQELSVLSYAKPLTARRFRTDSIFGLEQFRRFSGKPGIME
ncbi:heterokaryon incompatibility protein-domain-containing protein [Paraphoma chrysanthemicola]|uniref:Heterokaryon incompatibility protein-domain-containing protein n=1 Tax=Paraphoma chrysanthemicola TaxID=798071 RepID=A0A8K0RC89_9PLEO|nr:heterokaryon incompatibility protein-domain-containing protein [Paraphoma chrysanthemicola]